MVANILQSINVKFHFFGYSPSTRSELELTTSAAHSPNRERPQRLNHSAILSRQKIVFDHERDLAQL